MAEIRDELILADRFSNVLRDYAGGLNAAARAARASGRDMAAAAEMSAGQQTRVYQSMMSGIQREMARMDVVNEHRVRQSEAMVAAGKQESEAFRQLDAAMERSGQKYRDLAGQKESLRAKIESISAAYRQEQAAAEQAARTQMAVAANAAVQTARAMASNTLSAVPQDAARAQNAIQAYAQAVVNSKQQTDQYRLSLQMESQMLQLTIEKYGAGSAAAMEQAQAVKRAAEAVSQGEMRTRAYQGALEQAAGGARQAAQAIDQYGSSAGSAASATTGLMDKVKGLASAYLGLRGMKELAGLSDSVVQTRARLDIINDGTFSTQELERMIFNSAQRSRGDYMNTADMVSKMGVMAGDAFRGPSEIVAFTEQLNKMYTVSGTNLAGQRAATLQLQQAMAMGVLRGQEFRSVVQQVPMLVQAIGDSLGVSTGEVKKMADEGLITAAVVKNAMFSAADEINAKFETMPMTWGQVWTSMKNEAIVAAQPILDFANTIAQNWDGIKPVLLGVAAAFGVCTMALVTYNLIQAVSNGLAAISAAASAIKAGASLADAAATTTATGAQVGFNAALLACPLTWIILLIGAAVGAIAFFAYRWVQSVGGIKIAWLTMVDNVLTWWDRLKIGVTRNVNHVLDWLGAMQLAYQEAGVNIKNFMGDMAVGVATILQNMVNDGIGKINGFISALNQIPGVEIRLVEQVTFAASASAQNEAAKQARNAALADAKRELVDAAARRDADLSRMQLDADNDHRWRRMGIDAERQLSAAAKDDGFDFSGMAQDVGTIAGSAKKIEANLADEDLKYLEDVAVRRYETQVNTTSLTPSIVVNVAGSADKAVSQDIASSIAAILVQQASAHTSISYAEVGV